MCPGQGFVLTMLLKNTFKEFIMVQKFALAAIVALFATASFANAEKKDEVKTEVEADKKADAPAAPAPATEEKK